MTPRPALWRLDVSSAGRIGDRAATGLTAAEAHARSAAISEVDYRIDVDLSGMVTGDTFTVRAEVVFTCTRLDTPLWLDLIVDRVISVRHNGIDLDPAAVCGPERIWLDSPAVANTVVVEAVGHAGTEAAGLCRSADAADGTVYAWTQFQPFDARRMFPCFDQPDIRGTVSMSITAPAGWTCLSNASPTGTVALSVPMPETPMALSRTEFAVTPPLPPYLVAVCAGPFVSLRTRHLGITLGVHARASLADDLAASAPELFALTRHGLDVFSRAFGSDYPLDSYDHVFLPDQPGAMENMGCVTWSDGAIFRATPTNAQRARRALVLLHELSHQWFGNMVSPRWWDDLWLSESFADWAAVWAMRSYPALAGYPGTDDSAHVTVAMVADQLPSTHPVSRAIPDIDSVAASFDAITYDKGAAMLRQLVHLVGEQEFFAGVQGYLRRFEWSSVAIDGLVDEIGRVSEVDVRRWAVEWLRTAGINTLSLRRCVADPDDQDDRPETGSATGADGADGATGAGGADQPRSSAEADPDQNRCQDRVLVRQSSTVASPLLRTHRLGIGRYRLHEGALIPAGLVSVMISGPEKEVTALRGTPAEEILLPNDGMSAYAKTRTDPHSLDALLALGHTLRHPDSRGALRALLMDMLFDAELDGPTVVDTLVRMLRTEQDDAGLARTVELALDAARLYTDPVRSGPIGGSIAEACLHIAQSLQAGDSRWYTAWQAVTQSAWTAAQTSAIATLLGREDPPQLLRWRALARLLALGRAGTEDAERERRRDRDPDAYQSARIALAARPCAEAKAAALDLLLSPTALPMGSLARLGESLWQPHQHDLLRPYVRAYFDGLPRAIIEGGPARAMRLTRFAFPVSGLEADDIAVAQRLSTDQQLPEVARRALADQAALATRRQAAMTGSPLVSRSDPSESAASQ